MKYTDPRGLYWSPTLIPWSDIPWVTFESDITVTGKNLSLFFSVLGLLSGPPSATSGGFRAGGAGGGSGGQSPTGGDQAWPCGSNIFFDTLSGVIDDLGPITITGSVPIAPVPGLAGFGGSASFTARPDGSSDFFVGIGGLIGSSARASSLGTSLLKASSGGRPGGFTLRGAFAAGLFLGIRGSEMITQTGDIASVGLGLVGGASGSFTGGYTFHVTDPYRGADCR